jgi:EPS-associated MarR family transcriptional regulator
MPAHPVSDDVRYRLLKLIADHPSVTQRQLARELGISLGKINYCLHALVEKGWVKARNFTSNQSKSGYAYFLTARGIEEKISVTRSFLRRKMAEYEMLVKEIELLSAEVDELKKQETA